MTEPLAIPKRKDKARPINNVRTQPTTPSDTTMAQPSPTAADHYNARFSPASIDSCIGYTPSPTSSQSRYQPPISAKDKGKGPAKSVSMSRSSSGESPSSWAISERRASLLGSSIARSEHTVVNVGDSENPRLITCVKSSQGFIWNEDLFMPSYLGGDHTSELEQRRDPVQDIFITDEEAESMFPR